MTGGERTPTKNVGDARATTESRSEFAPLIAQVDELVEGQIKRNARIASLETTLRQIADPSYVGNYDADTVVTIYRAWAQRALVDE